MATTAARAEKPGLAEARPVERVQLKGSARVIIREKLWRGEGDMTPRI